MTPVILFIAIHAIAIIQPDRYGDITTLPEAASLYASRGNITLYAHSNLAGLTFAEARRGDTLLLEDTQGNQRGYVILRIESYRIDSILPELLDLITTQSDLTLVTCLKIDDDPQAGRLVVSALQKWASP